MKALWVMGLLMAIWGKVDADQRTMTVQGFSLVNYDSRSEKIVRNTRLMIAEDFSSQLSGYFHYTAEGVLDKFSYGELIWKPGHGSVDAISIGKGFPVGGRTRMKWRIDRNPWITFSSIEKPFPASDYGITVKGHGQDLKWSVGIYEGKRLFGNVSKDQLGSDFYFRFERQASKSLNIGGGLRLGPVPVQTLDVFYQKGESTIIGEMIASNGDVGYSVSGTYQIDSRTKMITRRDWPEGDFRNLIGFTREICEGTELKVTYEFGGDQTGLLRAQAALSW